jgi:hypothetical protein
MRESPIKILCRLWLYIGVPGIGGTLLAKILFTVTGVYDPTTDDSEHALALREYWWWVAIDVALVVVATAPAIVCLRRRHVPTSDQEIMGSRDSGS